MIHRLRPSRSVLLPKARCVARTTLMGRDRNRSSGVLHHLGPSDVVTVWPAA